MIPTPHDVLSLAALLLGGVMNLIILVLTIVAFVQRQGLVKQSDLDPIKSDMAEVKADVKDALVEVRKTNGSVKELQTWREEHSKWSVIETDRIQREIEEGRATKAVARSRRK